MSRASQGIAAFRIVMLIRLRLSADRWPDDVTLGDLHAVTKARTCGPNGAHENADAALNWDADSRREWIHGLWMMLIFGIVWAGVVVAIIVVFSAMT